ncbi:MAG: FecR domain-containing protein, partial [Verrucomicrobiota bacterium]|nr:FecR domain-containing protein [Verrucomicrobiota bacterium]
MSFTLRNLFKTKNLFASLFLVFISSLAMAQGGGLETGAVIVLSSKGLVEVTDPKGKIITKTLKPGMVLAEGFTIRTGITGEMSALFSNGMTATIDRQTILKISTFLQEPLQGANQTIEQTVDEPGPTTLALALDVGSLIVESKKLNKDSSFQIQTRVGTAGIRGTQFQLSQQRGGACKLDVSSSV